MATTAAAGIEVLNAVERASGRSIPIRLAPRRVGDPPALVARADRIRAMLEWRPAFADLDQVVAGALAWERRMLATPSAPRRAAVPLATAIPELRA